MKRVVLFVFLLFVIINVLLSGFGFIAYLQTYKNIHIISRRSRSNSDKGVERRFCWLKRD